MHASAQRAFKLLTSKIHHQLPLSPRESQQLLTLLTTSFRNHLDVAYPVADARQSEQPRIPDSKTAVAAPFNPPPHSSFTFTAKHLESILKNPLFAVKPQRHDAASVSVGEAPRSLENPLQWFEKQVASGTATLLKAIYCLETLEKSTAGMDKETKAGSKMLLWLWSSGLEYSAEFINRLKFIRLLVPRLLSEGKEDVLWQWFCNDLSEISTETGLPKHVVHRWKSTLLVTIISEKLRSDGIDAALSTFLHAVSLRQKAPNAIPDFILAERALMAQLAPKDSSPATTLSPAASPSLYNRLISAAPEWHRDPLCIQSLLHLHHPVNPTPVPGFTYLMNGGLEKPVKAKRYRALLMQLSLGVARTLLAQENFKDASALLKSMEVTFEEELGIEKASKEAKKTRSRRNSTSQPSHAEGNLVDLKALDGLALE